MGDAEAMGMGSDADGAAEAASAVRPEDALRSEAGLASAGGGEAQLEAEAGAADAALGDNAARPVIAVLCVGNKLMLDDGLGPAVYEELLARYEIPDNVLLYDVGCLSLDMLPVVERCDTVISVDAVDGTDAEPGTVFRFAPDAMARHSGATASLHDLKLVDLFDAAALLGYEAEGLCLGMQVENPSPSEATIGLTPKVHAALPLLVATVAGELARRGVVLKERVQG